MVGSFSAAAKRGKTKFQGNEDVGGAARARMGGKRMRRTVAAVSVYEMSIAGCKSWCGMGAHEDEDEDEKMQEEECVRGKERAGRGQRADKSVGK